MSSVLIIEDEEDLLTALEYNLRREGYRTHPFLTGEEGLAWATQYGPPDLALLDIVLPGMSGIEVCCRLRAQADTRATPIVFLTAKGEAIDRVVGFELGADDYVVKPFHVRELLLRIRAILRHGRQAESATDSSVLTAGPLRLDHRTYQLSIDQQEIFLSPQEAGLLSLLMLRKGSIQTREGLFADLWGVHSSASVRMVDVYIQYLRKKLGRAGNRIETIRGVGYRLRA